MGILDLESINGDEYFTLEKDAVAIAENLIGGGENMVSVQRREQRISTSTTEVWF